MRLDVKKAFDHVDHRAAFKPMRLQSVSPFFDGCNLEWKLHESTFGNGYVEQSSDESRLAPGCAGVSGHFHNDHGIRDLIKSWKFGNWRGASTTSDDVALVAASVIAAEVMVAEVIAKLKEVGLSVGAQKTHWTCDDGQKHCSVRTSCSVGGGPGICGVEGVFGRKCKIRDRAQNPTNDWRSGDQF